MTIDKGIFIRNIYYMLTYAFQELKQNNYEEIAGEEFDEIHGHSCISPWQYNHVIQRLWTL